MPLAVGAVLKLKVAGAAGGYDKLLVSFSGEGFEESVVSVAVPVRVAAEGVILAIPTEVLPEAILEAGGTAETDALFGPNTTSVSEAQTLRRKAVQKNLTSRWY